MSKLFDALKRRKVVRVASVYAVVAWLLIQVTNNIVPALQLPAWTSTFIVVLLLIGFIPTLIAAWAYEMTPDGLRPDAQVAPSTGLQATAAQPINYVILLVVLLVAGVQLAERFSNEQAPVTTGASATALVSGTQRTSIVLPARQPILIGSWPSNSLALSPDGHTLVYAAQNRDLGDASNCSSARLTRAPSARCQRRWGPVNRSLHPMDSRLAFSRKQVS